MPPLTRLSALHLLERYTTSQTEMRPTYRRAAGNEFYAMAKVLAAQGVPHEHSTPGLITQVVKGAWLQRSNDGTLVVDEDVRAEFDPVLRARIGSPLRAWEVSAVDAIATVLNNAVPSPTPERTTNVLTRRPEPGDPVSRIYGHEHVYTELPGPLAACTCGWVQPEPEPLELAARHGAWIDHISALETP